jgi:predicted NUDIX family phosphoesterase/thymidylate kinase
MSDNIDRIASIQKLEKQAGDVLELKKTHKQRRPIVIEFCGSPKSGKTSCINSLNIFLKRNGFKTTILTERASVCPINSKYNPVFNIWTSTSAINNMNEIIDSAELNQDGNPNIDVIICDRGIFDSLCWFRWLRDTKKMDNEEYQLLSNFVTSFRWRKNIDLIYTFTANPNVSIAREYANLLTNKRGSIMNEDILDEYQNAVNKTVKDYSNTFGNIHRIDTSEKDQNTVSYEVTSNVLNALKEILMEKIGHIDRSILKEKQGLINYEDLQSKLKDSLKYDIREKVEENSKFVQPIPVAIITNREGKVLFVKKTDKSTSKDSPEYNMYLCYAGGHMRIEDNDVDANGDFLKIAANTLKRELSEELDLSVSVEEEIPIIIYVPNTNKSAKHMAICWKVVADADIKKLDSYELVQKKGTSKSGTFLDFAEIREIESQIEDWSRLILKCYYNIEFTETNSVKAYQFDIFDEM